MNEAWASVFFPLVFLFSKNYIIYQKTSDLLLLALSFCFILLSHNPMALIFTPFLILWCIFWLIRQHRFRIRQFLPVIGKLIISALIAICLSAFFSLPVIFESHLVQLDRMFSDYYAYYNHFVSLFQLFISNFWGDGGSIWGPNDGMSFSVGYLHWILPLIFLVYIIYRYQKKHQLDQYSCLIIILSLFSLSSLFLTHERSTFLWKLFPFLGIIQFPWRFLNLSIFFLSLTVGFLPKFLNKLKLKKYSAHIVILLTLTMIIINVRYFTPVTYGPLTDNQKLSGSAWLNQISGGLNDYLPQTSAQPAESPASDYISNVVPDTTNYRLTGQKKGSDWQFFNINLSRDADITLSQISFPDFKLYLNGQPIAFSPDPVYGRITFHLPAGDSQIYSKLNNTFIRIFSNYLSIFTWLSLIFYLSIFLWKQPKLN